MKSYKLLLAMFAASLFTVSLASAAEMKKESVVAPCCAKAHADGKTCSHGCCVEAAKAGDNCMKCKGSGKIVKKVDAKK